MQYAVQADLRGMLTASRRCVVFTGAGISTQSGIPDYRSPGGLWSRYRPVEFDDFLASEEARREYWRRKFDTHDAIVRAQPNEGHLAIAELQRRGTVIAVITQNVDGLHGVCAPSAESVIELHGNTTYAACLGCAKRYELEPIRRAFLADGSLPVCDDCGAPVKTATISFGQAMPTAEVARAEGYALDCDLFLAIGSSLRVQPAAGLPILAKRNGARLVILNREATELDVIADLVLHAEIGPTLHSVL